ncbi:MAG: peptidylprolyl isomerase [Opitutaceae bacterium]
MKLIREPLFQFLLIGAVFFLGFRWVNPPKASGPERIEISQGLVDHLSTTFVRTWQRPPTDEEMRGLIREQIRDEVAYREALKLGLDRDDSIVRRRMRQKLELLSDDTAALREPAPGELERFFEANRAEYALDPEMAFVQIYLNPDKHDDVLGVADQLLDSLRSGSISEPAWPDLGDSLMLPYEMRLSPMWQIGRLFGETFADAVVDCPAEDWCGPVRSGFGFHLVRITMAKAGRVAEFGEVVDDVRRDWLVQRKKVMLDRFYDLMRARYQIVYEQEGWSDALGEP